MFDGPNIAETTPLEISGCFSRLTACLFLRTEMQEMICKLKLTNLFVQVNNGKELGHQQKCQNQIFNELRDSRKIAGFKFL